MGAHLKSCQEHGGEMVFQVSKSSHKKRSCPTIMAKKSSRNKSMSQESQGTSQFYQNAFSVLSEGDTDFG
jgi:hypothetical protein